MRSPHPEDSLKLEGEFKFCPEYNESFCELPLESAGQRPGNANIKSMENIQLGNDG